MPTSAARQAAYAADITYGTNNEFGFDYLRDNMKFELELELVQRDHHFAIVDEVDSILIDEARTPLIISGPSEESTDKYYNIDRVIPPRSARRRDRGRGRNKYHDRRLLGRREGAHGDPHRRGRRRRSRSSLGIDNLYDMENMELLTASTRRLQAHTCSRRTSTT